MNFNKQTGSAPTTKRAPTNMKKIITTTRKALREFFTFENHASNLDWRFY